MAARKAAAVTGPTQGTEHARILDGEMLDRGVGIRQLPVEGTHESEQRRDYRAHATRPGQALHRMSEI